MRDFLPGRRPPPALRDPDDCRGLRALRLRAARNAGGREPRDAARQVRRGGQSARLPRPQARGGTAARARRAGRAKRGVRRPGAALRPDGAAGARRRRAPRRCRSSSSATRFSRCGARIGRRAAASASSTSATSTSSARRRRSSRPSCAPRPRRRCARSGFSDFTIRLNHRAAADARSSRSPACRPTSTATRWSRSTSSDKIGAGRRVADMEARGIARPPRTPRSACS